jgi:hypothetical protein
LELEGDSAGGGATDGPKATHSLGAGVGWELGTLEVYTSSVELVTRSSLVTLLQILASWRTAACWLSLVSERRGKAEDGLSSAWMRLQVAAMVALAEEVVGILMLEGNQVRVPAILLDVVPQIQSL